jgi:hypothetical protein
VSSSSLICAVQQSHHWGAFNVSGVRWSSGCVVDGLEAVAVLVLSRVTYM